MAEDKKTTITIDGEDHILENMTVEQQTVVNHVADLEKKIRGTKFNLDQLTVGKDAFIKMLKQSLAETKEQLTIETKTFRNKLQPAAKEKWSFTVKTPFKKQ